MDERDWTVHPGEVLLETLQERGITQAEFARRTGSTLKHVNAICHGRATYSAKYALAMERALGGKPDARFWMALMSGYELALARGATQVAPVPV